MHHYQWKRQVLALTCAGDVERFADDLAKDPTPRARLLLKLDLTGRVPLSDFGAIEQRLATLADGLAHLDGNLSAVETSTGADDLAALGAGSIGVIAQSLAAKRDSGVVAEQQTAARALRTLARFAGQRS